MSEFKPGEMVDIAIKGARVHRVVTEGHDADVTPILDLTIIEADGRHYHAQLPADWTSVTVERCPPAKWPPRKGDLWRDRDRILWCAMERFDESPFIELEAVSVNRAAPGGGWGDAHNGAVMREYGPLTLVHREDEQDEAAVAAQQDGAAVCHCGEPGRSVDQMYQCEADDCVAHDWLAAGEGLGAAFRSGGASTAYPSVDPPGVKAEMRQCGPAAPAATERGGGV